MWTINYKGFYIHGYCDRDEVSVQHEGFETNYFKSMHAAKCAITRMLKTSHAINTINA